MERQDIVPKQDSKLLRTILRNDVHDNLTEYSKSLSTGRGDWDYGVAIERLLEMKDIYFKQIELECRIEKNELDLMNNNNFKNPEKGSTINPHGLIGKNTKKIEDIGETENGKN